MYPVSEAFQEAVQENTRKFYWTGRITTKAGVVYEFGNEDIVKGSGYISSQCCGSSEIEIGTVYAAEMGITLYSGIDRYTLEDAKIELFYHPFKELATFGDIFNLQILQPWELATLGYLFVLFIVSAAHCVVAGFEDKIRTRAYLQFLIDVTLFLFVLIVLQPSQCSNLLPLLMISNSILIGHLFVLTNNKTSNIFFIVATVCLILLFGFNVWTLL